LQTATYTPAACISRFSSDREREKEPFKMMIIGDTQAYSQGEVGYVRDTQAKEFATMGVDNVAGVVVEGDVMSDDLGPFPVMDLVSLHRLTLEIQAHRSTSVLILITNHYSVLL
jgi:hypothetical protein